MGELQQIAQQTDRKQALASRSRRASEMGHASHATLRGPYGSEESLNLLLEVIALFRQRLR
jgi:hypothetical protein